MGISSAQLRAARALLRWSALDLAKASRVGVATIRRVEVMDGNIPVTSANEAALRKPGSRRRRVHRPKRRRSRCKATQTERGQA